MILLLSAAGQTALEGLGSATYVNGHAQRLQPTTDARLDVGFPGSETIFKDGLPGFPHQPEIEREVLQRRQLQPEDLIRLEEVPQIGFAERLRAVLIQAWEAER